MKVIVPPHISGFWYVVKHEDPLQTGSLGAGLTLSPPLVITLSNKTSNSIYINNEEVTLPPVKYALTEILKIPDSRKFAIKVFTELGLGLGYGLSAAYTLGATLLNMLINKDFLLSRNQKVTLNEAGKIAHIAEVTYSTGYGDLMAELHGGGLVVRVKEGGPNYGIIDKIPVRYEIRVFTVTLKKPKYTKQMLHEMEKRMKSEGLRIYKSFLNDPTIENFADLAHEFSLVTGLMTHEENQRISELLKYYINIGAILNYFIKKSILVVIAYKSLTEEIKNTLQLIFGKVIQFSLYLGGTLVIL